MILKIETNQVEFFSRAFNNNYPQLHKYFSLDSLAFSELIFNVHEAVRCLVTESYTASITMTNYLLERLLKLALVEDELCFGPITHPWQDCYDRMHPYIKLNMHDTINMCRTKQLISREQKKQLGKYKDMLRNGYSHSQTDLIFKDYPETYDVYTPEPFNDVTTFNLKKDPRGQTFFLQQFSKDNALPYFDYVYKLITAIEENLVAKYPESYNSKQYIKIMEQRKIQSSLTNTK